MSRTDPIFVARARTPEEREACFAIRREVFVEEQQVLPEEDRDGLDDKALHFLASLDRKPAGTARVRFRDEGTTARIERLAVRKEARGCGIGEAVMKAVEADGEVGSASRFVLAAQTYIVPFYERLGYKAEGEEFMDARIPHRLMTKENRAARKRAV
jgi:predicted GNAT family N-acyltransferase